MIIGRWPPPSTSAVTPLGDRQPRMFRTTASSGRTRHASTSPRKCLATPPLSTTWRSTAWCMPVSCDSLAAKQRSSRSTRPPSIAPQKARSRSSATATSWPLSGPTRRLSKRSPRWRQTTSPGTASMRSIPSRKRRGGCCSSPRSIGPSAPLRHRIQCLVRGGTRRPIPECTSPMPRSHRPARWPSTAMGGCRCGRIRKGFIRCAMRWPGP